MGCMALCLALTQDRVEPNTQALSVRPDRGWPPSALRLAKAHAGGGCGPLPAPWDWQREHNGSPGLWDGTAKHCDGHTAQMSLLEAMTSRPTKLLLANLSSHLGSGSQIIYPPLHISWRLLHCPSVVP